METRFLVRAGLVADGPMLWYLAQGIMLYGPTFVDERAARAYWYWSDRG